MKRGQVGFEIMIAIAVLTLIFIALSKMSIDKKTEVRDLQEALNKRDVCLKISNLITSTYSAGDGTITNLSTKYVVGVYPDGIISIEDMLDVEYLELGYYCCHQNECQFLGSALQENFYVDEYIVSGCGDRIVFSNFLNNISKYDVIFLEDPHLDSKDLTPAELATLNNFVSNGKFALISEHVKQDGLFGLNLKDDLLSGTNPATVQMTDPTYPGLFVGQEIYFTEKPGIDINGYKSSDVNNFKAIAKYYQRRHTNPAIAGLANWEYKNGYASFFSDFDECDAGTDDDPGCLEWNLSEFVVDHIIQTVSLIGNPNKTSSCTYPVGGGILNGGKFTGLIEFININNKVEVTTRS